MMFLTQTQGKTNWKFLLIIFIIAVIIGGGILVSQYWWIPKQEVKNIASLASTTNKEVVTFGRKTAYIKENNSENFIILSDGNIDYEIDRGEINKNDTGYPNSIKYFSNLRFSPTGKYLIYSVEQFEFFADVVYNTEKKKKEEIRLEYPTKSEFTPDEKYFYACAYSSFSGDAYGNVYKVPEFELLYDVYNEEDNLNYVKIGCEFKKEKLVIVYTLSCHVDERACTKENEIKREIEYFINTGEVQTKDI